MEDNSAVAEGALSIPRNDIILAQTLALPHNVSCDYKRKPVFLIGQNARDLAAIKYDEMVSDGMNAMERLNEFALPVTVMNRSCEMNSWIQCAFPVQYVNQLI